MARLSQSKASKKSRTSVLQGALGHLWTIAPNLLHRVRPKTAPRSIPWSVTTHAPGLGGEGPARSVTLRGALCDLPESDALVVVVHGLGGTLESHYAVRAARVLDAHGFSTLRIALRGADRSGEDFYHAGLVADLDAAFASPALRRYRQLFVLGYSLGGHVSLHAAVTRSDPRLLAVAAVCAPLHLDRSAQAIDAPSRTLYRRHVLSGLNEIYAAFAAKNAAPTPLARVLAAKTIREWDSLTVVPRYGFADVDEYYSRMSVAPRLAELSCPTLLLPSRHDPMVPPWTFTDLLACASPALEVHWVEQGGHVGYPPKATLRGEEASSVEARAAAFFAEKARESR